MMVAQCHKCLSSSPSGHISTSQNKPHPTHNCQYCQQAEQRSNTEWIWRLNSPLPPCSSCLALVFVQVEVKESMALFENMLSFCSLGSKVHNTVQDVCEYIIAALFIHTIIALTVFNSLLFKTLWDTQSVKSFVKHKTNF